MQKARVFFSNRTFLEYLLLAFISALAYLLFVTKFGYYYDDWYLMYAAGAKGTSAFLDIFSVDRPMRALVMSPAYFLFGGDPVLFNLSAWGFRVLSAWFFYWGLSLLWAHKQKVAWLTALLYLIYPGFLSQLNGIDYQSQMVSLAVMMLSLVLTIYAYQTQKMPLRLVLFVLLALLTTFYLGLVEYFVGMEVFKAAVLVALVSRAETNWSPRSRKSFLWVMYSGLTSLPFLVWRLFFFESERGATDVNVKLGDVLSNPFVYALQWMINLLKDLVDVVLLAWVVPLQRLSVGLTIQQWLLGGVVAGLILVLVWQMLKGEENSLNLRTSFDWRMEAIWLGGVMLVFGLLPVILVGRYVDFKSFSRYALAPSIGAVMLWQAGLSYISVTWLRKFVLAFLIGISLLTHYANGLVKARETELTRNFWWQVGWRAPGIDPRATLITRYAVAAEEDYFTWGPANLIYYPDSNHEQYTEPVLYAMILNEDTIEKIIAREPQEYSNRRSIRTYPNPRNILILTQPTPDSCVQVIDLARLELSSFEDARVREVAPYSEADQISLTDEFRTPPFIPFGVEPQHGWCYYYQKASFSRQAGEWDEVLRLGEEAISLGYFAKDQIEWMPFLQAYALSGNSTRLDEIASFMTSDLPALKQACLTLTEMMLPPGIDAEVQDSICVD